MKYKHWDNRHKKLKMSSMSHSTINRLKTNKALCSNSNFKPTSFDNQWWSVTKNWKTNWNPARTPFLISFQRSREKHSRSLISSRGSSSCQNRRMLHQGKRFLSLSRKILKSGLLLSQISSMELYQSKRSILSTRLTPRKIRSSSYLTSTKSQNMWYSRSTSSVAKTFSLWKRC